ncbi:MAG: autotransporter-associated beta strand repeat-containing protein [Opitutaceae bacterium]|jgi:autotransporter-associated beta strand protein|nr:autotransporter-associated beta strand repeat-containing protein [Opitutaceae bacterium]
MKPPSLPARILLLSLSGMLPAAAADFIWKSSERGQWTDAARWNPSDKGFPKSEDDNVTGNSGAGEVFLMKPVTIRNFTTGAPWSLAIHKGCVLGINGTLTLDYPEPRQGFVIRGNEGAVSIARIDIKNGSLSFGTGTTHGVARLSIGAINLSGGTILFGVLTDYELGLVTFLGGASKTINLARYQGGPLANTVTVKGLVSAPKASNIRIIGGSRDDRNKNIHTMTLLINTTSDCATNAVLFDNVDGCDATLALIKSGQGAQTLGGASTYSGGTIVREGRLLLANTAGSATGSGDVTVENGALGGAGSIALPDKKTVTIKNGATLAPGSAKAGSQLSIRGDLKMESGSVLELSLGKGGNKGALRRAGGDWTFARQQTVVLAALDGEISPGIYKDVIAGLAEDPGVRDWKLKDDAHAAIFTYARGAVGVEIKAR